MASAKNRNLLAPPLLSAARYQRQFEELVSDPEAVATPKALAESLRSRLLPARDRLELTCKSWSSGASSNNPRFESQPASGLRGLSV
jgi:hypothetical protein